MGQRWNDTGRGKSKNSDKNLPQCHFFHHACHGAGLKRELGSLRWELCRWQVITIMSIEIVDLLRYYNLVWLGRLGRTKNEYSGRDWGSDGSSVDCGFLGYVLYRWFPRPQLRRPQLTHSFRINVLWIHRQSSADCCTKTTCSSFVAKFRT
jgi:hypothetical protein